MTKDLKRTRTRPRCADHGVGPLVVSQQRWERAQRWELEVWKRRTSRIRGYLSSISALVLRRPGLAQEDWNSWWFEHFDGYRVLPQEIRSCLEIGCGPYTNMRLLMKDRAISRIVCSDPLASEYVRMRKTWLAESHKRGLVTVDSSPGERLMEVFKPAEFEVVLLINVLDHVRDAEAVLTNAMSLTAPGGYLVVGQDLSHSIDLVVSRYDIGHPIKIEPKWVERRVVAEFDPLLIRDLPRSAGRNPAAHCGTLLMIAQRLA